jgi:thiol-disulfide isomerase/thioredoxin
VSTGILIESLSNYATKITTIYTSQAFADQTTQAERAIAYFTATWCPPCRTISPVFASLRSGRVHVYVCDDVCDTVYQLSIRFDSVRFDSRKRRDGCDCDS